MTGADQGNLFQPSRLIAETMTDGTPYSQWQRAVIAEWHRRHPAPLLSEFFDGKHALVPRGVYCLRCKGDAVMFPGESLEYPDNMGYCICPRCSLKPKAGEAAS